VREVAPTASERGERERKRERLTEREREKERVTGSEKEVSGPRLSQKRAQTIGGTERTIFLNLAQFRKIQMVLD
jgi:hypothetical protein